MRILASIRHGQSIIKHLSLCGSEDKIASGVAYTRAGAVVETESLMCAVCEPGGVPVHGCDWERVGIGCNPVL